MDPRTKYILDDIAKLREEGDTDTLAGMKDYWDGFNDGIRTIVELLDRLKIDMINPVKEAFEEKEHDTF